MQRLKQFFNCYGNGKLINARIGLQFSPKSLIKYAIFTLRSLGPLYCT